MVRPAETLATLLEATLPDRLIGATGLQVSGTVTVRDGAFYPGLVLTTTLATDGRIDLVEQDGQSGEISLAGLSVVFGIGNDDESGGTGKAPAVAVSRATVKEMLTVARAGSAASLTVPFTAPVCGGAWNLELDTTGLTLADVAGGFGFRTDNVGIPSCLATVLTNLRVETLELSLRPGDGWQLNRFEITFGLGAGNAAPAVLADGSGFLPAITLGDPRLTLWMWPPVGPSSLGGQVSGTLRVNDVAFTLGLRLPETELLASLDVDPAAPPSLKAVLETLSRQTDLPDLLGSFLIGQLAMSVTPGTWAFSLQATLLAAGGELALPIKGLTFTAGGLSFDYKYYKLAGVAIIAGRISGEIDFVVIRAAITAEASASLTMIFEACEATDVSVRIKVNAAASVEIGWFTVEKSFALDTTLDASFGSRSVAPWGRLLPAFSPSSGASGSGASGSGASGSGPSNAAAQAPTQPPAQKVLPTVVGKRSLEASAAPIATRTDTGAPAINLMLILALDRTAEGRAAPFRVLVEGVLDYLLRAFVAATNSGFPDTATAMPGEFQAADLQRLGALLADPAVSASLTPAKAMAVFEGCFDLSIRLPGDTLPTGARPPSSALLAIPPKLSWWAGYDPDDVAALRALIHGADFRFGDADVTPAWLAVVDRQARLLRGGAAETRPPIPPPAASRRGCFATI